jgi:hypothetical protein
MTSPYDHVTIKPVPLHLQARLIVAIILAWAPFWLMIPVTISTLVFDPMRPYFWWSLGITLLYPFLSIVAACVAVLTAKSPAQENWHA